MAERTKLWIANTMRELMKQKSIDRIRVSEICKAAEIQRPTFYYHFRDKYDLVAWMFCEDAYGTDITSVSSAAAGMSGTPSQTIQRSSASRRSQVSWRLA